LRFEFFQACAGHKADALVWSAQFTSAPFDVVTALITSVFA
jgi:hypothetical protein